MERIEAPTAAPLRARADGSPAHWLSIAGLALAHWTGVVLWSQALNNLNGVPWQPDVLPAEIAGALIAALISVGCYAAIRAGRRLPKWLWPWTAVLSAVAGSAMNAVAMAAVDQVLPMLRPEGASGLARFTWETLFFVFPFALWTLIVMVLESGQLVREREARLADALIAARDAEIRALHYQVNPHFLYNALNSISTLILDRRPTEADRMVMGLAAVFRANLTADPLADVRLAEEIDQQRLYLSIEKARYLGRLRVLVDVADELADALVPTLILQPLVENAVKHGVHAPGRETCIAIAAARDGDTLVIRVVDNGPGASSAAGTGVGLENVRKRLEARFPGRASLNAHGDPDGGFVAALRLPFVRGD